MNENLGHSIFKKSPNKALHRTAIPLRSIAAGELGRWAFTNMRTRRMKKAKAAMLLGALMINGTAVADLNTGLVAYYCFDDETNIGKDCSANGNNGSPTGQVNSVTGVKGNAANFGGYNNPASIHIPNSSSLQFVQDFTISFALLPSPSKSVQCPQRLSF